MSGPCPPDDLKAVLAAHKVASVSILTTVDKDGTPVGTTISSFTGVSVEPPIVLACLHKDSKTLATVEESGLFAVNFLCEESQDLADHFAKKTCLTNIKWTMHYLPALKRANAVLRCRLSGMVEQGTHVVIFGSVEEATIHRNDRPLIYWNRKYHNGAISE